MVDDVSRQNADLRVQAAQAAALAALHAEGGGWEEGGLGLDPSLGPSGGVRGADPEAAAMLAQVMALQARQEAYLRG